MTADLLNSIPTFTFLLFINYIPSEGRWTLKYFHLQIVMISWKTIECFSVAFSVVFKFGLVLLVSLPFKCKQRSYESLTRTEQNKEHFCERGHKRREKNTLFALKIFMPIIHRHLTISCGYTGVDIFNTVVGNQLGSNSQRWIQMLTN